MAIRVVLRRAFDRVLVRYLFAVAIVAIAFGLRILLAPWTGKGAPFVLLFGAALVTTLVGGAGPGLLAFLLSLPIAAITFAVPAGATVPQAAFQAALYGIDGAIVVYLTHLAQVSRRHLLVTNRELRDTASSLATSEAQSRQIIELSPDGYFLANLDGTFVDVNAAACRLLGCERGELLGKNVLDILSPDDRPRVAVVRQELLAPGAIHTGEWILLRKDGTAVPVETSSNILPGGRWQAFVRDIRNRKRAEREQRMLAEVGVVLAASLDYEQTLATVAGIAAREVADWCVVEVIDASENLRRLKVASAAPEKAALAERLEKTPVDRERPHLTKPVVDSRRPWVVSHFSQEDLLAASEGPDHVDILRAIDPVSVMSVPLLLRDELLGTLTFISSSPSRLFSEADLPLAVAVAERAALAIENARLYRAAVHAANLRDQVLGVVAHDLRNPLSAISLQAAALARPPEQLDPRSQHRREAIERAARRMNRLIQDLLDVAVLESGRLRVEKAPLSPRELLDEAIDSQKALATASSIDMRVEVAPDIPWILGDHDRLLEVFENLIGNALKFTQAGGRVTVAAARGDDGAIFSVADTGCGMSQEELACVFDRFWQASSRAGRLGAGLGLPITKGIIEAHGGRIWAESKPGQGSSFSFSIPAAPPSAAWAAEPVH